MEKTKITGFTRGCQICYLDEDELFKYMQMAHDQGTSFNEFCEKALKEVITKDVENP